MKSTEEIIKPYKDFLKNLNYKTINNGNLNPDIYLFQKWAHRVPKGWYGFSLGNVPFRWAQIIDDFLVEVEKECPDFEIHQVKLKFGSIRCYLELNIIDKMPDMKQRYDKVQIEIEKLEKILFHKDLIY